MSEQKIRGCNNEISSTFWGEDQATRDLATQCRDEMGQKTGEPYSIGFWPGGGGANYVKPYFWVFQTFNCNKDQPSKFDDYIGDHNAVNARECATALNRVTKLNYEVVITSRFLFADIYTVVKAK